MDNPHIVKENLPYTIKRFVTGRPLDQDTVCTPDEHGNYPVSPLGFLYSDTDGSTSPVPGMSFGTVTGNDVYETIMASVHDYMYELDETPDPDWLTGRVVGRPISSIGYDGENYVIRVPGPYPKDQNLATGEKTVGYLGNADECNDYSSLGIIGRWSEEPDGSVAVENTFDVVWGENAIYNDEESETVITIPRTDGWRLTGTVGEQRLILHLAKEVWINNGTRRYVMYNDSGILYTCGNADHMSYSVRARKPFSGEPATPKGDELTSAEYDCNGDSHIRNGYSDREVMEWVEQKMGGVMSSGIHAFPVAGKLEKAGALVQWFAGSGNVDISGGMGRTVLVDGFGLGAGYFGQTSVTVGKETKKSRFAADGSVIDYSGGSAGGENVTHPILTFGYGTTHRAKTGTGEAALPFDWPFSSSTATDRNNNITLTGTGTVVNGRVVGKLLDTEVCGTCPACHGMGVVAGVPCATCGGTGDVDPVKADINRAHVCLFNDFAHNTDADTGYTAGTTVLKKTFIHLAAPIDTKDGAEYELTVSLPGTNTAGAFNTGDIAKDLSAYYAYVSQPRVYVLGGRWQFTDTRVDVVPTLESGSYTLTGNMPFVDSDGEMLSDGTDVRFTLSANRMHPRSTELHGVLASNNDDGCIIEVDGDFPYDIGGRGWIDGDLYICGLAYLDAAEPTTPGNTPMGLVSRSDEVIASSDYGDGDAGDVNEYNRLFTLNEKAGRTRLGNRADNRYVLATVYPTATNTFPWAISGRRKVSCMDRLLTDEAVAPGSLLDMAWKVNRDLVAMENLPLPISDDQHLADIRRAIGWEDGVLKKWGVDSHVMSYTSSPDAGHSVLPRVLRVRLPSHIGADYSASRYTGDAYEVTKRAVAAVKRLTEDFTKIRLRYTGPSRSGRSYIPALNADDSFTWNSNMFLSDAEIQETSPVSAIWKMRMRHTPGYIYDATVDNADPTLYSYDGLVPFDESNVAVRDIYKSVNGSKYTTPLESTADNADVPCDLTSVPMNTDTFSCRNIITEMLSSISNLVNYSFFSDILREAELQSVELSEERLAHPYRYRYGSDDCRKGQYEIIDSHGKIMSVDGIPSPSNELTVAEVLAALSDRQRVYVGGDAFASYRYECSDKSKDTDFDFLSATLPTSDSELSRHLRSYVPMYASGLPMRSWDSFRVYVPKNGTEVKSPTYYARLAWLGEELDACEDLKRSYANDMFIRGSSQPYTADCNLSWFNTDTVAGTGTLYESSVSVPPGTVTRDIYADAGLEDPAAGRGTYIRVYMKFVFSAKAGRWYCADYRQVPVTYLTPLYGAQALDAELPSIYNADGSGAEVTIDGDNVTTSSYERIWKESVCGGYSWKDATRQPYYNYPQMNISAGVVPFMYNKFPYKNMSVSKTSGSLVHEIDQDNDKPSVYYLGRLDRPYLPIEEGGIGLYPPADCHGGYRAGAVSIDGTHANFWRVRAHVRPAVAAMPGTDIPGVSTDPVGGRVVTRTGGSMSDPTLYGQFAYPAKDSDRYHTPDPENPMDDMGEFTLIYKDDAGIGDIQVGSHADTVYAFKK